MLALSALCFFASISVIILREPRGIENRKWIQALEKGVKAFGAPKTVFTFVILILAWVFHRDSATELISILASWTLIVALNPIEAVVSFASWTIDRSDRRDTTIIGAVAAHQSPGLVLIRQNDEVRYKAGTLMALSDDQGPTTLGVALNYVGRDDGILLRALSLPIPPALKSRADEAAVGSAAASLLLVDEDEEREVKVLERISSLCGIVDSDSDLEFIEIEVINDQGLAEGRLVDVKLRGEDVIYQIISGVTREDAVQQKNKYGYVRAKARKNRNVGRRGEEVSAYRMATTYQCTSFFSKRPMNLFIMWMPLGIFREQITKFPWMYQMPSPTIPPFWEFSG